MPQMRRLARHAFTALAGLSLLLCLFLVFAWVDLFRPQVIPVRVGIPVIVCSAIAPAYWLIHAYLLWRGDRRKARGLCPACGYDLRASPGRCAECGADGPRAAV